MDDLEEGIKVEGRWIKALRFADDQEMVAKNQKSLQAMMNRLDITSRIAIGKEAIGKEAFLKRREFMRGKVNRRLKYR